MRLPLADDLPDARLRQQSGQAVFFFQDKAKFKARYATIGFNDTANLDEGELWATSFALKELTPAAEASITKLVKKAAS